MESRYDYRNGFFILLQVFVSPFVQTALPRWAEQFLNL